MLQGYLLKMGIRHKCPLLFLFNVVLELLANVEKQDKEIKDIRIRKENIKFSLLINNIIVCVKKNLQVLKCKGPRTAKHS